ncbi:MAG: alpha/beta fold hydrolase [Deltaproteobacteria bacterium]|nr:alpha/beta fold hydrolase [Deltaproteobacteria bacterium]
MRWIREQHSEFTLSMNNQDIREGFEYSAGSEYGMLLLHGFTGTPYEMRPAGEYFYQNGFTVICPRLAGHGTTEEELDRCSFYDWIDSAERALASLIERVNNVYVFGLSMGGLIALKLASVHREIKKVIVVASPLYLTGENGLFVNASRIGLFRMLVKSVKKPEPKDERYRKIWKSNPSYRGVPTRASYEFYKLMQSTGKSLRSVSQSIMFVYSRADRDVSIGNLSLMVSKVSSRDICIYIPENMGHLITLEEGNTEVFRKVLEFIRR